MISGSEISCFQQLLYYFSYMCEHCYLGIDDRGQMLHVSLAAGGHRPVRCASVTSSPPDSGLTR